MTQQDGKVEFRLSAVRKQIEICRAVPPVGGDAHIVPQGTVYHYDRLRRNRLRARADVGIGPYERYAIDGQCPWLPLWESKGALPR